MTNKRTLTLLLLLTLLTLPVNPPASAKPQTKTYTVNSSASDPDASPGNGICATASGKCTLHAAIQEANADGDYSIINFASQFQGTQAFDGCSLPAITDDFTTIDASNRWDTSYDIPGVEILGGDCDLLVIHALSTTVLGVCFNAGSGNTTTTGVHITGGSLNNIGGTGSGQRNVFLTDRYGVWIESTGTYNDVVNNYFGTVDGETLADWVTGERGIFVQGGSTISTISDNLIVGQSDAGILIWADNNVVTDNIIGLNRFEVAATALPNAVGVKVFGDQNVVGPGNVIAGNTSHGVQLYLADDTSIVDNEIDRFGRSGGSIGNGGDGIHIDASHNTQITGNDVTENTGNGVWVDVYDVTIQGNIISENGQDGVYLGSSVVDSQIGGSGSNQRNVIGDSGANGVHLYGAQNVTVSGNYIGLSHITGADGGNQGHGILIENGSTSNTIGGTGSGEGNWIGFNHQYGIRLSGSNTQNNYILGNVIGAPFNWAWEAANHNHGIGIYDGAHDNWIGDGTPPGGNTVLASGWSGVAIVNSNTNWVVYNRIGTDGAGINWGNHFYGVNVVGGANNAIVLNEIAYNGTHAGEAGVRIDGAGATGNAITQNSIHDNDGAGIELVNNGNINLPAPTISQANCQGPVAGTACVNCFIEIFSDNADEGRVYEAFTTDPTGAFSWNGTPNGPNVTATARDSNNNTSPFSAPFPVGTCNTSPTAAFAVTPTSGDTSTVFSFDASACSDAEDATSALQVRWDWENDGTYDTSWNTTKTASHSYAAPGTYTVRLEVQDTGGLTDATTRQVTVQTPSVNTPPTAAFTVSPSSGDTSTVFGFDASACSDAEDATSSLQVRWDWENDGTFETNWDTAKTATHTFNTAGTHTVRLEVMDSGGLTDATTRQVTVSAQVPPACWVFMPLVLR
jgi:PKD repeat protein